MLIDWVDAVSIPANHSWLLLSDASTIHANHSWFLLFLVKSSRNCMALSSELDGFPLWLDLYWYVEISIKLLAFRSVLDVVEILQHGHGDSHLETASASEGRSLGTNVTVTHVSEIHVTSDGNWCGHENWVSTLDALSGSSSHI